MMKNIVVKNWFGKRHFGDYILIISSMSLVFFGLSHVYGVEVFPKDDKPFGISNEEWISKWWTWFITNSIDEATPKKDGCLIHDFGPMVGLMNPAAAQGTHHQVCKISSKDGIMINLWSGWMESSISKDGEQSKYYGKSYEELSKAAREDANLGHIVARVNVDGVPIAELDENSKMQAGVLDYKIYKMENVTEVYSKGFNITIPEDTYSPDQNIGTWPTGAHGWFVFLKPLPSGPHTIYYSVDVGQGDVDTVPGTGPNDNSAKITYNLQVE